MKKTIIFVIACGVFFRFWQVTNNFHFMMDEERDALIFARVFRAGHVPLIGGSFPGGLYVGPLYTWISSIFLFIFQYDYSRLGYISAIVSGISLIFLYLAAKKSFNEKIAFFAVAIYSFSFLIVQFNKRYWPPTFAPALFIFVWYALTIAETRKKLSLLIIAVSMVIGVQSDPSNVATFLAVIIFYFLSGKTRKHAGAIFGLVMLSHVPLLLFELRHQFFLTRALWKFFTHPAAKAHVFLGQNLIKLLTEIARVFSRLLYVGGNRNLAFQLPPEPPLVLSRQAIPAPVLFFTAIVFIGGLFLLFREKNRLSHFLRVYLLVMIFGIFCYNLFFPGYTYEWFFNVSFPALAALAALCAARLGTFIPYFLLTVFMLVNALHNIEVKHDYAYAKKLALMYQAKKQLHDQDYSLISLGKTYVYSGYRYLADQINFSPVKSYMDVYYEWLYPAPSRPQHPEALLVFVNYSEYEDEVFWERYRMFKKHAVFSTLDYPIGVLIVDNKNGWFNNKPYDYFQKSSAE